MLALSSTGAPAATINEGGIRSAAVVRRRADVARVFGGNVWRGVRGAVAPHQTRAASGLRLLSDAGLMSPECSCACVWVCVRVCALREGESV